MKQEETIHSLTRTTKTIQRSLKNLQLRLQNLQKAKQSKLKNIHSRIIQHETMVSPRSKVSQSKKLSSPIQMSQQKLPGIDRTRQSIQEMKLIKSSIVKEVKMSLNQYKQVKREQDEKEKENRVKLRNYQRLRELQGKEKIDQFWNSKIDFYRNKKYKETENLRKKIGNQQSKLQDMIKQEEILLKEIRNVNRIEEELKETVVDYGIEKERQKDRVKGKERETNKDRMRQTGISCYSSSTLSPKKLKYIKLQHEI